MDTSQEHDAAPKASTAERYTVSVADAAGVVIYLTTVDVDTLPAAQFAWLADHYRETGRAAVRMAADAIEHGED